MRGAYGPACRLAQACISKLRQAPTNAQPCILRVDSNKMHKATVPIVRAGKIPRVNFQRATSSHEASSVICIVWSILRIQTDQQGLRQNPGLLENPTHIKLIRTIRLGPRRGSKRRRCFLLSSKLGREVCSLSLGGPEVRSTPYL